MDSARARAARRCEGEAPALEPQKMPMRVEGGDVEVDIVCRMVFGSELWRSGIFWTFEGCLIEVVRE